MVVRMVKRWCGGDDGEGMSVDDYVGMREWV